MEFIYCTACGEKLITKEIGDEGLLPFCPLCNKPFFDLFNTCVIVMVVKDDRVLLLKQNYVSEYWVLVAGFIKKGETAEEAVAREVEEETGLKTKEHKYISSYFHEHSEALMLGYLVFVEDDKFTITREVDDLRWFNINEVDKYIREGSIAKRHIDNVKRFLNYK